VPELSEKYTMKILIAEDNPKFRCLLEEMLSRWGYDVLVADNGITALQILQSEESPRLAILDWMMPGADGVVMADIDFFKKINDSRGHMVGNIVLKSIAGKMHSLIRSYDYIGRYGGDEFLVVLPECRLESAAVFAERLRLSISSDGIDTSEGMMPVFFSFGVAVSCKNRLKDADSLLKAADETLYLAK
jgi:diguanylate cyclase (GGDEF)-like protein